MSFKLLFGKKKLTNVDPTFIFMHLNASKYARSMLSNPAMQDYYAKEHKRIKHMNANDAENKNF